MVQMARPRGEIMAIQETEKVLQSEKKKKTGNIYMPTRNQFFFPSPPSLTPSAKKEKAKTVKL